MSFSDILKNNFNNIGIVSRIGGDEFAILMPGISEEAAKEVIENVKKCLEQSTINSIPISAAFGLAVYDNEHYSFYETFKQADENMYKHKLNESEKIKRKILSCIIKENFKICINKKNEVKRVFGFSKGFAKQLNLEEIYLERLKKASLVYDIGYITINLEYLNIKDKLLEKEWEEIKTHPATAYHILKNINQYSDISEIVLSHHENYDGTGYPRRLVKEQIPLEARILRIVIDYCAMTSKRLYRDAMTKSKALEEIVKYSGIRYDNDISSIFIEWMTKQKEL
jgi:HD-GYP domain-containing protein (c-di-GMP phosphodiesterase class II)